MDKKFCQACRDGDIKTVCLFLADPRVNPADPENLAIRWASYNGHLEVVKLLLTDPRVNPADQKNASIRWASRNGQRTAQVVRLLLADPRVNPKGEKDGIYIQLGDNSYVEIAIIDEVVYRVDNGNVESIDEKIREKFVKWQYRIGGEKYMASLKTLEN
jgi:ankyrin repeat protein